MAIDTKSLSQLIAEFRKLQAKDSITPESLGYILQRIADLLATAGTSETQAILGNWYNTLSKVDHTAVCKLQQGPADRNFVRLSNTFIDLLTGQQMTNENATISSKNPSPVWQSMPRCLVGSTHRAMKRFVMIGV